MTEPASPNPTTRVCFRVPGQPVAKGRPIAGRGFNGHTTLRTPEKTVAYESLVSLAAEQAMAGRPPFAGPCELRLELHMQLPTSWSGKKRAAALNGALRPTTKPDCSNVLKSIEDAMNGIAWIDDKQVIDVRISKRYGEAPMAIVEIVEIQNG